MNLMFRLFLAVTLLGLGLISGCSGWTPAPGDSKATASSTQTPDGYYRVRRGDTLHAIAFKFGMDWRNIAQWNGIQAPYTIYPDQDLRLSAPGTRVSQQSVPAASQTSAGSSTSENGIVVTAAPSKSASSTTYDVPPETTYTPETTPAPEAVPVPETKAAAQPPAVTASPEGNVNPAAWLWPAEGKIISNFAPNDPARKGIDIGGKEGQAILASAAGEVVYSGSGLIGYGELVIIKHSEQLLSAYAHNQERLVTEGQKVTAGERIANMGKNDRNQAMLHFEIRLNGNPQDPLKYLPGR